MNRTPVSEARRIINSRRNVDLKVLQKQYKKVLMLEEVKYCFYYHSDLDLTMVVQ